MNIFKLDRFRLFFFCIAITFGVTVFICYAKLNSLEVSTYHLDGAYQTASGLFRIDEGQVVGKDFYPYLGVGVTYFLYPFYKIFGSSMAASTAAAYFVTLFGCIIATTFIFYAVNNKLSIAFLCALILVVSCITFPLYAPNVILERLNPGNSLRPIRSLIPYLSVFFLCFLDFKRYRTYLIASFFIGLSLLWSNDYGIPTALMLFIGIMIVAYNSQALSYYNLIVLLGGALLSYSFLLLLSTNGNVFPLLRYNFVDVANDQYWYFGGWGWDQKILSWHDLFMKVLPDFGNLLLVLPIVTAFAIFKRSRELILLAVVGWSSFFGGALAIIGGHREGGYVMAYQFWSFLTLFSFVLNFFFEYIQSFVKNTLPFLCVLILGVCVVSAVHGYLIKYKVYKSSNEYFFEPTLGGFLPNKYLPYIAFIKAHKEEKIVEEYWGLWSAFTRNNNTLPVDAVIHALGDTRDEFLERIKSMQPNFVVTTSRNMSLDWQPWNVSANYWFYKYLFENYTPNKMSPTTVVWTKGGGVRNGKGVGCHIHNQTEFIVQSEVSGFFEVNLGIDASKSARRTVLMVKNNLNSPIDAKGYLALDKSKSKVTFPVFFDGLARSFPLRDFGSLPSQAIIRSCEVRHLNFEDVNVLTNKKATNSPVFSPYELTDNNWNNGIGRRFSALFVENTLSNVLAYKDAKKIKFYDGKEVQVSRVDIGPQYINIWFDGELLDGLKYGYPHIFTVLY